MSKLKKKKKKSRLSEAEKAKKKAQRAHRTEIRTIFSRVGFQRILGAADLEIEIGNVKTDIDDVFVLENIVVVCEYTTTQSVGDHLKGKKAAFEYFIANSLDLIREMRRLSSAFADALASKYQDQDLRIVILYCSRYFFDSTHKNIIPGLQYMDYEHVQYFKHLSGLIYQSARYEMFAFLGVDWAQFGENSFKPSSDLSQTYMGSMLSEGNSSFPVGHKIVSFYIDPETLLRCSYVLRRDGWRSSGIVYQRILQRAKLSGIRAYLVQKKRVFVNNIIATLPPETRILDLQGQEITDACPGVNGPVRVELPVAFNSIGVIDGQHRIFSYYEGGEEKASSEIGVMRKRQNLLVTGLVYPSGLSESQRSSFEARLFREINSTQTSARGALRQAIGVIVEPFKAESIALAILEQLNGSGPLGDCFERTFFERGKVKTTSVIRFGLLPLVKPEGSLFKLWGDVEKNGIKDEPRSEAVRSRYVKYCSGEINKFISASRQALSHGHSRWTTDAKVKDRLITATVVNTLLVCMRHVLETGGELLDFQEYKAKFDGLSAEELLVGKSSQYTVQGRRLYEKYFAGLSGPGEG